MKQRKTVMSVAGRIVSQIKNTVAQFYDQALSSFYIEMMHVQENMADTSQRNARENNNAEDEIDDALRWLIAYTPDSSGKYAECLEKLQKKIRELKKRIIDLERKSAPQSNE
ncbi:MAG: hypothetical protein ABIH76_08480 [Candidatus Bathyarchaeota archaeon]